MKLVFLGPPGAGKGTQAERLSKELGIPHISTGEILRHAVSQGSPLGIEASKFLQAGQLVPDDLMVRVVSERLSHKNRERGYILDGFPRTLVQARALEAELQRSSNSLDAVIYFDVSKEVAIRRLSGRRVCPKCGENFHVDSRPPASDSRCDQCKTPLVQREDDRPETIARRLEIYDARTAELIRHYEARGLLKPIPAHMSVDQVYSDVKLILGLCPR